MQEVKAPFTVALLCATSTCFVACNRARWPVTREMCGQVHLVDSHAQTVLTDADLLLYRANTENLRCCSEAEKIADIRIDSTGKFKAGRLDSGRYFLVVKNSPRIIFAEYLETPYDGGRCSLNTVYSFNRDTGETERTATIVRSIN